MTATLSPVAETYDETARLLTTLCVRFQQKYGGELQELLSEAREHFMGAYNTYDYEKGHFPNWLYYRVWKRMLETVRTKLRKDHYRRQHNTDFRDHPAPEFNPAILMLDVSEDAAFCIKLVLDSPLDIILASRQRASANVRPHHIRAAVLEFLKDLGWTASRIGAAFQEVADAL